MIALASALKSSKVAHVKLACTGMGPRGALALADLLPFPHLVSLYIPDNAIGDEVRVIKELIIIM